MARHLYRMAEMHEAESQRLDYAVRAFNDDKMNQQ